MLFLFSALALSNSVPSGVWKRARWRSVQRSQREIGRQASEKIVVFLFDKISLIALRTKCFNVFRHAILVCELRWSSYTLQSIVNDTTTLAAAAVDDDALKWSDNLHFIIAHVSNVAFERLVYFALYVWWVITCASCRFVCPFISFGPAPLCFHCSCHRRHEQNNKIKCWKCSSGISKWI